MQTILTKGWDRSTPTDVGIPCFTVSDKRLFLPPDSQTPPGTLTMLPHSSPSFAGEVHGPVTLWTTSELHLPRDTVMPFPWVIPIIRCAFCSRAWSLCLPCRGNHQHSNRSLHVDCGRLSSSTWRRVNVEGFPSIGLRELFHDANECLVVAAVFDVL